MMHNVTVKFIATTCMFIVVASLLGCHKKPKNDVSRPTSCESTIIIKSKFWHSSVSITPSKKATFSLLIQNCSVKRQVTLIYSTEAIFKYSYECFSTDLNGKLTLLEINHDIENILIDGTPLFTYLEDESSSVKLSKKYSYNIEVVPSRTLPKSTNLEIESEKKIEKNIWNNNSPKGLPKASPFRKSNK